MKSINRLCTFTLTLALFNVVKAGTTNGDEDEYGIKKFDSTRSCVRTTIDKEIGYVSQIVGSSSVAGVDLDILCNDIEYEFGDDANVGLECGIIETSSSQCEFMLKTVFIDMKNSKKADTTGLEGLKSFKRLKKL